MRALLVTASLLIAIPALAIAQPGGDGRPLSPLPSPNLPESDRPSDYLRAAQSSLAAGHIGEAQQALEMAQTRMLDRAVPLGQTDRLSDNPTVVQISHALQALAARDRNTCMQFIQNALQSSTAQGL